LISVALRLQVAIKVSQEDELTIATLQQQAADSKTKEILANRNAQEAAEMVGSLTFEINQLRRKLKIAEGDKSGSTPGGQNNSSSNNEAAYQMSYAAADTEVDELLNKPGGFPATKFVDKEFANSATPFERWKMNQFIYTPDTPAASEEYDRQVVQMLLEASALDLGKDVKKPTKAGIAKMRRPDALHNTLKPLTSSSNRTHLITTADGGANVYETVGVNVLESPDIPPHSAIGGARRGQEEKIYFLDKTAPNAMWGASAVQALQRTSSLGGTVGFGAGRETGNYRPGTAEANRAPPSPIKSPLKSIRTHQPPQTAGSASSHGRALSPENKRTKGINSMIV
jgi:hypothetical protein